MKQSGIFWLISLITGVKIQKPIKRVKRTRSVKYHFLAKGLAKKSNPYRKRKSSLFKLRSKKRRTVKRKVKLFKLR